MSTLSEHCIEAGDVVEFPHEGSLVSALVLLATSEALILDFCDGTTPFVIRPEELLDFRVFSGV